MIYTFFEYFLFFLFYSFIGWALEVIQGLVIRKKFVNRGFLIGPCCPIYGYGVLLITFLLNDFMFSPISVFLLSMIICMVLEYITSYFMEVFFKARCWDYSDKKFNINGRVCLETGIPFGLGGAIIMYVVNPFVMSIINKINPTLLVIIGSILLIIYIIDNIISFSTIIKIDKINLKEYKDNTEEITKRVKEHLKKHSLFTKRLLNAFPNMIMTIKKK